MKKLVWVAGLLLAFSLVFPNGVTLPVVKPSVVTPQAPIDETIVKILTGADAADKTRIVGVYTGLSYVLKRDGGKRVSSTEKWAEVQGNTLDVAIEQPGKYAGLDEAIEAVFLREIGTDDVTFVTPDVLARIIRASDIVASSAATAK